MENWSSGEDLLRVSWKATDLLRVVGTIHRPHRAGKDPSYERNAKYRVPVCGVQVKAEALHAVLKRRLGAANFPMGATGALVDVYCRAARLAQDQATHCDHESDRGHFDARRDALLDRACALFYETADPNAAIYTVLVRALCRAPGDRVAEALRLHDAALARNLALNPQASLELCRKLASEGELDAAIALARDLSDESKATARARETAARQLAADARDRQPAEEEAAAQPRILGSGLDSQQSFTARRSSQSQGPAHRRIFERVVAERSICSTYEQLRQEELSEWRALGGRKRATATALGERLARREARLESHKFSGPDAGHRNLNSVRSDLGVYVRCLREGETGVWAKRGRWSVFWRATQCANRWNSLQSPNRTGNDQVTLVGGRQLRTRRARRRRVARRGRFTRRAARLRDRGLRTRRPRALPRRLRGRPARVRARAPLGRRARHARAHAPLRLGQSHLRHGLRRCFMTTDNKLTLNSTPKQSNSLEIKMELSRSR